MASDNPQNSIPLVARSPIGNSAIVHFSLCIPRILFSELFISLYSSGLYVKNELYNVLPSSFWMTSNSKRIVAIVTIINKKYAWTHDKDFWSFRFCLKIKAVAANNVLRFSVIITCLLAIQWYQKCIWIS